MSGGKRCKGLRRKRKNKGEMLKLMREALESWKSQETKLALLNRRCGQIAVSRCAEKTLAIGFKSVTKMELNQSLCQLYATVKNRVSAVMLAYMQDFTIASMTHQSAVHGV